MQTTAHHHTALASIQEHFTDLESGARAIAFQVGMWRRIYNKRRVVICIAGPTASGKSTLTKRLFGANTKAVTVLNLDRYYRDEAELTRGQDGLINWDTPEAMDIMRMRRDVAAFLHAPDGGTFSVPEYNFPTNSRIGETTLMAKSILIVEGMYALDHVPALSPFRIYVDAAQHRLLTRKLSRDVTERGKKPAEVRAHFAGNVVPGITRYVAPQKAMARFLIRNDA